MNNERIKTKQARGVNVTNSENGVYDGNEIMIFFDTFSSDLMMTPSTLAGGWW
jgi:hypothetical protein